MDCVTCWRKLVLVVKKAATPPPQVAVQIVTKKCEVTAQLVIPAPQTVTVVTPLLPRRNPCSEAPKISLEK